MKQIKTSSLLFAFLILLFYACRHEPLVSEDQNPDITGNTCDPDTIYFNKDLLPLLASTCARAGCHDAASQMDGVILTDYESVMQTADVRPGNPNGSDLYEVLTEDDLDKRMPPPPNLPFTTEQIQMVYTWIMQGAKNLECIDTACNLDDVTYSQTVTANLQSYGCVGCHSGSSANGGVILSNYTAVADIANSGRLMGAINRLDGFAAMPPSGSAMAQCPADQIQKWINNGTPDN